MNSVVKLTNTSIIVTNSSFIGNVTHNRYNITISGGALVALNSTMTIRECSFINNSARNGGAIYAIHGTKLMVESSTLFNNTADHGGAISIEQSNATLEKCILHSNTAHSNIGNGGAIAIDGKSTVAITNTSISNNTAVSGGGLYIGDCQVFIEDSVVSNNHAINSGGALYCSKNSITASNVVTVNTSNSASTNNYSCNVYIRNNSRIINNHALNNGGGLYVEGKFLSLERSHISYNLANYGGGVYGSNCHMVLSDNTFALNTAVLGGGAMCLKESHPIEINNSTFSSNRVKYGRGAAIQSQSVFIKLVQCIVNNNTAIECGALDTNMVEITDSTFGYNSASGMDEVGGGGALCVWNGYARVEGTILEGNEAAKDGGVMIINNTDLTMLNSHVVNNKAYRIGGIKASYSNITIIECQFYNSTGTIQTGIMRAYGCNVNITTSIFHNNSVLGSTAVLHFRYSETSIKLSKFSRNSAPYYSVLQVQESLAIIDNCTFERNEAIGSGVIRIISNSSITVSSSYFSENRAQHRGAVFIIDDSVIILKESTFRNCTSKNYGAVMSLHRSTLMVLSCYFIRNHARMSGGVFDISDASNVTIWTSLFMRNTAGRNGGAVDIYDSKFAAFNCTFDGNNATGGGGVIQLGDGQATIEHCSFTNNHGIYGGVIHTYECLYIIKYCQFSKNAATVWGGVANFYKSSGFIINSEFQYNSIVGGGGVLDNSRGNITIQNCYFSSNKAINNGGVMDISRSVLILMDSLFKLNTVVNDGGVMDASRSSVRISNCSFFQNNASDGGVIDSWLSSIAVDSSLFLSNMASQDGGAIMIDDSNLTLCDCILENNTATYGGGIAISDSNLAMTNVDFIDNKANYHGGAVHTNDGKVTMKAVFIVNNSAINGGGLYLDHENSAIVTNSIFYSNFARDRGGAIAVRWQSTISINETNIHNNTAKWGTAISNCNGHTRLSDLMSAMDPVYTYCTIYEGDSDNYDVSSNMLDICSIANVSLSMFIIDAALVAPKSFTEWSNVTNEGSTDLTGDVSTTESYGNYSETISIKFYLTTSLITEESTEFPEECPSSHSDTGYIVALVIVSVLCLILLGYIAFNKGSHKMQSLLTSKRVSCETKINKMINIEQKIDKCSSEDESLTGTGVKA
jgi:predicted outer membrane repeat protein